ncbi:hypothetical protein BO71DRAFT_170512 [Aspergillus ellipticus CBS 707.79]|uniref:Uncharacterized protein n=1 Tax=Aspergillus ellipticus CBS 707.79 TaxID=1448320 RepID=A0A319EFP7_9EURO|nr:hypothetical protein BO71DRAFT_170512 [Aspergillus ellipticus CBS 707.79]
MQSLRLVCYRPPRTHPTRSNAAARCPSGDRKRTSPNFRPRMSYPFARMVCDEGHAVKNDRDASAPGGGLHRRLPSLVLDGYTYVEPGSGHSRVPVTVAAERGEGWRQRQRGSGGGGRLYRTVQGGRGGFRDVRISTTLELPTRITSERGVDVHGHAMLYRFKKGAVKEYPPRLQMTTPLMIAQYAINRYLQPVLTN